MTPNRRYIKNPNFVDWPLDSCPALHRILIFLKNTIIVCPFLKDEVVYLCDSTVNSCLCLGLVRFFFSLRHLPFKLNSGSYRVKGQCSTRGNQACFNRRNRAKNTNLLAVPPTQMLSIQKMTVRPPSKNNVQDEDREAEEDIDDSSRNNQNKTNTLDKQVNDEIKTNK